MLTYVLLGLIAVLLAVFLYLGISLQFVDAGESCNADRLAADRIWLLWYTLGALLFFTGAIALPRWSSLLMFLAGFMLIHPGIILFYSICLYCIFFPATKLIKGYVLSEMALNIICRGLNSFELFFKQRILFYCHRFRTGK